MHEDKLLTIITIDKFPYVAYQELICHTIIILAQCTIIHKLNYVNWTTYTVNGWSKYQNNMDVKDSHDKLDRHAFSHWNLFGVFVSWS